MHVTAFDNMGNVVESFQALTVMAGRSGPVDVSSPNYGRARAGLSSALGVDHMSDHDSGAQSEEWPGQIDR